jgi:2'-5' RNA ligase
MNYPWSVWLEPCQSDRLQLQALITKCCGQFNSPVFEPHITLFGRVDADPAFAFSRLKDIVSTQRPIELSTVDILRSESPWKTLFIQFEKSGAVEYFQTKIDQELNQFRSYEFDPHLSLAYGNFDINESELDDISFPETIIFSSVVLMAAPDEIDKWELIFQADLIGGMVL